MILSLFLIAQFIQAYHQSLIIHVLIDFLKTFSFFLIQRIQIWG